MSVGLSGDWHTNERQSSLLTCTVYKIHKYVHLKSVLTIASWLVGLLVKSRYQNTHMLSMCCIIASAAIWYSLELRISTASLKWTIQQSKIPLGAGWGTRSNMHRKLTKFQLSWKQKLVLHRTKCAEQFRKGNKLMLFSSDVSARGVDYPATSLVVQASPSEIFCPVCFATSSLKWCKLAWAVY